MSTVIVPKHKKKGGAASILFTLTEQKERQCCKFYDIIIDQKNGCKRPI